MAPPLCVLAAALAFRRRLLLLAWLVATCLLATPVSAQRTGGSFGGGSFGGGSFGGGSSSGSSYGGGSSSGSSYGGGSSSSSYGGGSSSSGSSWGESSAADSSSDDSGSSYDAGGSSEPVFGPSAFDRIFGIWSGLVLWFVFAAVALGSMLYLRRRAPAGEILPSDPRRDSSLPIGSWNGMDVTAISLAIDSGSRAFVQERLMTMAKEGDTDSPQGLAALCRDSSKLLRDVSSAWLYAGARNHPPMEAGVAESAFRALATDYRARYRHELVRAESGDVREARAPTPRARAEEGEGVAVVSLLVAARTELFDLADARSPEEIQIALSALAMLSSEQIVALEVIWSPAEQNDRMSTAELEALYPELGKLDASRRGGRVTCWSCRGPYAAELGECPHCGSPPPARNG